MVASGDRATAVGGNLSVGVLKFSINASAGRGHHDLWNFSVWRFLFVFYNHVGASGGERVGIPRSQFLTAVERNLYILSFSSHICGDHALTAEG